MTMPLVSVILPVFNAERTIVRAVRSILDQSWSDLELIVVNDGSFDGTVHELDRIHDERMRVLDSENRGVSAAANLGLKHSNGRWVARMDADDYSHARRIEKQLNWLRDKKLDAVGCQVRIIDPNGEPVVSMKRYEDWINRETIEGDSIHALRFVELPLVNPTIMARREYFELGFRTGEFPEDYDLFLRAIEKGFRCGKVPEVLFDWTETSDGLTRSDARYSSEAFDRCRKKYLLRGPLHQRPTIDLWGAGQTGKRWLKWLQSQQVNVRHLFDVSPKRKGQRIHGCIVLEPESMIPFDETPIFIAVGRAGARDLILPFLEKRGYTAGVNAWFVA